MNILSLIIFLSYAIVCHGAGKLTTKYEWKYIEYEWDSDEQKQSLINSGDYNQSASLPVDVDMSFGDQVFITILRTKGVPATLGLVTNDTADGGPIVRPYPNWEYNQGKNCVGLLNVYRITFDDCGRLWALDSGMIDNEYKCPAKLVAFNLENDTIADTLEIPRDVYKGPLMSVVIHNPGSNCEFPTIFMTDAYNSAIIIYDGQGFCRLESILFEPNEQATTYTVEGDSFTRPLGVHSMAITERSGFDLQPLSPILYWTPLSSYKLYWSAVYSLQSFCQTQNQPYIGTYRYEFESQTSVLAVANRILFFAPLETTSLHCYNTVKYFTEPNDVSLVQDKDKLQWVSGLKSYPKNLEWAQKLIMLSNKYQKYVTNKIDTDEVNYQILTANADELAFETNCY